MINILSIIWSIKMNIMWCGKCLPKTHIKCDATTQQLSCFFLSFSSLLKFAKLFPHFCLLFTFLSIWNFCFRYRIPQAHTYIMYHTQVTCLHASIHACLLFEVMIYINLSEYIPLSWCIHCTREYQTNMKEWMKKKHIFE